MSLTSERLDRIQPSLTIAISTVARRMIAEGKNVISLSQGEPDFDTPRNIKDAAIRAIEEGQTKYTDVAGTPALRKAVAEKFKRDSGIEYKPEEIIIATGAKQVLFNAMVGTLNAGDEVIIPSPCWVSYPDIVTLADGKPVLVPCSQNNGFKMRPEDLEAAITPKTRWFMLNNPCNPTGAGYSAEDLRPICDVLLRHPHVWVLTDDIYDSLVYGGFKPATIVAVEPTLRDRTLTVHGVSKAYAMTGWRIGFAGGPVQLIKAMDKLQSQSTSNPNSIAQAAAVEALTGPQQTVEDMRKVFEERRDLVVSMLNQAPGMHCTTPEGAFYVYPSIQGCLGKTSKGGKLIKDDEAFALALLDEEGVATVHGAAFCYPGYIRISYANATEELREAMTRIQRFCQGLH
ncbi:pyridoxal phosphate-dependent aminotransferase [Rhodopila sp.]|uniref:pyridoxal phosphate-dependent aminotransferase n=1 Tax=Rhodopila sp. TaxID=2480087 RepID=UPI002B78E74B|nr:pyridoxal phosphate-dependent aminotransferase [Rhodopila sp.]HVZ09720.1 pyridoxal phosphate-dependent aminotransferase [Rhodopila sp.]